MTILLTLSENIYRNDGARVNMSLERVQMVSDTVVMLCNQRQMKQLTDSSQALLIRDIFSQR